MTVSLARRLARRLDQDVSDSDRSRAALHVLDWAGCAAAGRTSEAGRALAAFAPSIGEGDCAGVASGRTLSPAAAAFLNGGLGNVMEMDDIHRTSILHPGPVVAPAALAAAESRQVDATAFLNAVVRGYEAVIRIGVAVGPGHYSLWHNTSTCGPFGAVAAVGDIIGLSEDEMAWGLGNAGAQSSGPWRCRHEAVMTKQLHTARAAQSGLIAAELAALGFTGPEFILEGEQGFFAAMAPDGEPEAAMSDPSAPWKIWDTSFKPWPACRHAHPTIDAALTLREGGVSPKEIAAIRIETYRDAVVFCDRPNPKSAHEAKFSLQHSVAQTLASGAPHLSDFEPEAISGAAALRDRVEVTVADPWAAAYPQRYGAAVSVTLASGEIRRAEAPDALGDPDNPVDKARLVSKARELCGSAGWTNAETEALIASALDLADGGAVEAFANALSAPRHLSKQDAAE